MKSEYYEALNSDEVMTVWRWVLGNCENFQELSMRSLILSQRRELRIGVICRT